MPPVAELDEQDAAGEVVTDVEPTRVRIVQSLSDRRRPAVVRRRHGPFLRSAASVRCVGKAVTTESVDPIRPSLSKNATTVCKRLPVGADSPL